MSTSDLAHEGFVTARRLDRKGYLSGLRLVRIIPDKDVWNAEYDEETDVVILRRKLFARPMKEIVRVFLHEGGHRGQYNVDRETFKEFGARRLDRREFFVAMANAVHKREYDRTGKVYDLPGEVFAESYARFCLGMLMPAELKSFWQERS